MLSSETVKETETDVHINQDVMFFICFNYISNNYIFTVLFASFFLYLTFFINKHKISRDLDIRNRGKLVTTHTYHSYLDTIHRQYK